VLDEVDLLPPQRKTSVTRLCHPKLVIEILPLYISVASSEEACFAQANLSNRGIGVLCKANVFSQP
jgi:hypothetical protein